MLTAEELGQARADLDAELADTVTIRRQTGSEVDPDTLAEVPIYTVVYAGLAALVTPAVRTSRYVEEGDRQRALTEFVVTVSAATVGVVSGDQIDVDASSDPETSGRALTVLHTGHGTVSLSRRIVCQEGGR